MLVTAPLDGCTSPLGSDGVRRVMIGLSGVLWLALLLALQGLRMPGGRRWAVYATLLGLVCVLGISLPVMMDEVNRLGKPTPPARCPLP
ncbi:MAG: hypothetical protein AB7K24_00600 [Gemmataceae bacterium]